MPSLAEARSVASLLRWLGPWADPDKKPPTRRTEVEIRDGYRAWLYTPRDRVPHAAYLVAPGLHYLGPADPRVDRFLAILAASGFMVLAPFLPDFVRMNIAESVVVDFAAAFEWLETAPGRTAHAPGVFSISFGSLPALRLASNPAFAARISHLVCFGGFADLSDTLEYCLTGEKRDPLNQPAAFINLLDYIDGVPSDRDALVAAWKAYMEATWGRPEMKARGRHEPIAHEIADSLATDLREMFLIGTGHEAGGIELCRPALAKMSELAESLDVRRHLHYVRRPVTIVHGKDDDVIPFQQAVLLASAFPQTADVKVVLTGLYDHSRAARDPRLILREGAGMIGILAAISGVRARALRALG